mmetsp:Transcript_4445/g.11487  ORF Transcript_4445/g.11487 Transcript_4445/m.11487 type:complete len:182 (-) Transcript_4445:12-557(-)
MRVIEGSARIAFLGYFLSHIPITLFIDAQGLFGPHFPKVLTDVVAWYNGIFGDVLMKNAPSTDFAWFSSLICCEILFQFPFFFVAIKYMLAGERASSSSGSRRRHYPEWFRMACIVYGTHVSTTLVPIIAVFVTNHEMTIRQKCATIASKDTKGEQPETARTFDLQQILAVVICFSSFVFF